MMVKKLFMVLALLFTLSCHAYADSGSKIQGTYTELPGIEFKFDGKQVEIIEFFSFYCSHCFEFEQSIPAIKKQFPNAKWRHIPIYWGEGSPKPGEAYLIAKEEGKGEEMKKAIFNALFLDGKDIGKIEILEEAALSIGLGFDFSRRLRSGEKAGEAGEGIIMTKTYNINETPTMIIAGNLKTSPNMLEHNMERFSENAVTMLKSLFNK